MRPADVQLLFEHPGLTCEHLDISNQGITLTLTCQHPTATCPKCNSPTTRVHSHYSRTLRDLPWAGRTVTIKLQARRFRCCSLRCPRRIFTERLPALIVPYARITLRLHAVLLAVALTVGAEPGKRLLAKLGVPVSGDKLLNVTHNVVLPTPPPTDMIGMDDFALKKGRTYGTVIIDLHSHQPIALLPGRDARRVMDWLQAHPGVELVTRDRSTEYERAVNLGAPGAQHVLDRWHVLKNLREVLQRTVKREQVLRGGLAREQTLNVPPRRRSTREEAERAAALERRRQRVRMVKDLHKQGLAIAQIARQVRCSRTFVRVCIRMDGLPESRQHRRAPSPLEPFVAYLHGRWNEGCKNAMQLLRELQERGFQGSYKHVHLWSLGVRSLEAERPEGVSVPSLTEVVRERRGVSPLQLSWLMVLPPARLNEEEHGLLGDVLRRNEKLRRAHELAQEFLSLVRERRPDDLGAWLQHAEHCERPDFRTFAASLRREQDALLAAVALPWSNGPTEGVVNRIKLVKRLMFGRGSFELLSKRVLLAG